MTAGDIRPAGTTSGKPGVGCYSQQNQDNAKKRGNAMPLLQDHIAVVTGAGSGIGRAIAAGHAREGARVVLLDTNETSATEAAQGVREAGGPADDVELQRTPRDGLN